MGDGCHWSLRPLYCKSSCIDIYIYVSTDEYGSHNSTVSTTKLTFKNLQEIHYDRIGGRDAAYLVNADVPDVIEIWNNVFIQYNRESDRSLRPLPAQHIDTGMGMERLTSILQNVDSNYDTDIFQPLFAKIQELTGAEPYTGRIGAADVGFKDMAYRVVADHIRTLSFAIADGAVPSNDGRGYVLRRILRRAVRYGRQNLGAELGFFSKLIPTLGDLMGGVFPELLTKQAHITFVINEEEDSFSQTLDRGLSKFKELAENSKDGVFSGEDAHFLYTSMGFPVDLTELMAEEISLKLDREAFEAKMQYEQELSAAAHLAKMSGGSGKDMRLVAEQTSALVGKGVKATDDDAKYVWNQDLEGCTAMALFIGRNETEDNIGFVDAITSENGAVGIILDKSSFYAESGGQTYDTGVIVSANGATMEVEMVQLYGQFVLHLGKITEGTFTVGDSVICKVDYVRRAPIASNHTMTHVLNYALQEVLVTRPFNESGKEGTVTVDQKGSLVDETKLRFDFSWNGPLGLKELKDVEEIVQGRINDAVPVEAFVAPLEAAQKISSLRAVFGEKYPDPVRVVSVAPFKIPDMLENPQDSAWKEYSVEFCGGTHLTNTKEAEAFVLLSEEGIAKGIRRITGVTMADATKAILDGKTIEDKVKAAGSLDGDELEEEVKKLTPELNELSISAALKIELRETLVSYSKKVVAYKKEKVAAMTGVIVEQALAKAASTEGEKVVLRYDFGIDGKIAKAVTQAFGKQCKDKALMLITGDTETDRIMIVAATPKGVAVDCKAWVDATTEGTDGKGGGNKDSAQSTLTGMASMDSVVAKALQ